MHPPIWLASSPGHSQILSRSRGEKSGDGRPGRIFFFLWTHFRLWMTPHLCIDNIYLQTYDLCMRRTTPSVYLDL